MNKIKQLVLIIALVIYATGLLSSQNSQVELLNEVISELIGEQDIPNIPTFRRIKQACRSQYISCNKKDEIIGLNFQFSNLNGVIPESIYQLDDLEYIDLEYNYLSGTIPHGVSKLQRLKKLSLHGNFVTGPLPEDLDDLTATVDIDLSQNVIINNDKKLVNGMNIIDQVNLEGCRSPDSIYLTSYKNIRKGFREISADLDDILGEEIVEDSIMVEQDSLTKIVETMPRFPGCENDGLGALALDKCAQQKMLQFIYRNLKYPSFDRNKGIEGMVVAQFVVLEDGSIGDVTIVRSPGGRMGNSGLWVVNRMNYICDKWIPGVQAGKAVKVLYTLPLKFKLQ